jgi:hypothetical protein
MFFITQPPYNENRMSTHDNVLNKTFMSHLWNDYLINRSVTTLYNHIHNTEYCFSRFLNQRVEIIIATVFIINLDQLQVTQSKAIVRYRYQSMNSNPNTKQLTSKHQIENKSPLCI